MLREFTLAIRRLRKARGPARRDPGWALVAAHDVEDRADGFAAWAVMVQGGDREVLPGRWHRERRPHAGGDVVHLHVAGRRRVAPRVTT